MAASILFRFFRACPGQLLVYAICKEGSPKNMENVALVSPAMEIEVCKTSEIKKKHMGPGQGQEQGLEHLSLPIHICIQKVSKIQFAYDRINEE